jgi:16S rRNA (cytidine1402-2'-O)-methyltransferase
VLVIEGKDRKEIEARERKSWESMTLQQHMEYYEKDGLDKKEAMKKVASDRGISKRDVYNELLKNDSV